MGPDLPDVFDPRARDPDEAVADRQDRLGDDRERRVVEQVMCLVDRTGERALDRHDAVRAVAADDGLDDLAEVLVRDEARGGKEPVARGCGVCALAARVGDGQFVRGHRCLSSDGSAGGSLASRRGAGDEGAD